jgi:isoleucyl-tRNA synthetase
VVCLGHVVDEQGRKMSKHLGNVTEPMGVLNEHGADAVRWFFAASGSPWAARRIGPGVLDEIARKVLGTYWNVVSFLALNESAPGPGPAADLADAAPLHGDLPALDRWLLSEVQACVRDVTAAMDAFDSATAGRRISGLIEDLSNWYVRRSRRRLRAGSPDELAALRSALVTVTKLMAPIAPFLADHAWSVIRPPGEPPSVHLAAWPAFDARPLDRELSAQMAMARRLVELGRSARAAGGVGTRQPLSRALAGAAGFGELPGPLRALVAEELNVHDLSALSPDTATTHSVQPRFRALGKRFGARTPAVAAAIREADPALVATALADGGSFTIAVPGIAPAPAEKVTITTEDVVVTQVPVTGWEVATANGETVALDLTLTPSLRAEGLARELIRRVQQARKSEGLAVTDPIMLRWSAPASLASAIAEHSATIEAEVLAVSMEHGAASGDELPNWSEHGDAGLGLRFWLRRRVLRS